jgi:hypothetical protein
MERETVNWAGMCHDLPGRRFLNREVLRRSSGVKKRGGPLNCVFLGFEILFGKILAKSLKNHVFETHELNLEPF